MGWLTSNLLTIGLLGLIALVASFFIPNQAVRWIVRSVGIVSILLLVVGAVVVITSAPGGEDTVDDAPSLPPEVRNKLEALSKGWDSEASANWPVAELMAELSEASYEPPVDAYETFKKLGFEQPMPLVDGSMLGYVTYRGEVAVIVFRGTDNNIDWIVNLTRNATQTPKGPIHRGFYDAYAPMKLQLSKVLTDRRPKHVWVTGHSLGGAMAVVCAQDLIENQNVEVDGLITFGQPMLVRQPLVAHLDQLLLGRYAHYVNSTDIVARIPPSYSHCGSLVWFTAEGVKRSKPKRLAFSAESTDDPPVAGVEIEPISDQELEALKAELKGEELRPKMLAPDGPPYAGSSSYIQDHAMALYLEKIRGVSASIGSH